MKRLAPTWAAPRLHDTLLADGTFGVQRFYVHRAVGKTLAYLAGCFGESKQQEAQRWARDWGANMRRTGKPS